MSDIKVIIGGDASELNKELKKTQVELAKTSASVKLTDNALAKFSNTGNVFAAPAIKKLTEAESELIRKNDALIPKIQGAIDKISSVHDASKKAESGIKIFGVGIAELIPSLVGPVGIGIAFAAVGIAIELFKDKVYNVDLKPLADKLALAKKEENAFRDAVNSASESVVKQAKDISDLSEILISTTQDIKNITSATINLGVATFLFDKKNVAVQKLLTAEIEQQLKLRKQNAPLAGSAYVEGVFSKDKITRAAAEAKAEIMGINELSQGLEKQFAFLVNGSIKAIKEKTKAQKEFNGIRFKFDDSDTILFDEESGAKALGAGIKNLLKSLKGGSAIGIPVDLELDPKIKINADQAREGFIRELEAAGISTTERVLDNGLKIKIPVTLATAEELIAELNKSKKDLANFQKSATDAIGKTINDITSDTISNVADSVGAALAGDKGAVPRLFDNIILGIGQQIKELGKYLVKIGVEKLAIDKAIEGLKLSPGATIAAGFAAQVLGSLLISAAKKKAAGVGQGFATGVRNLQEGGVYQVGERGPETIYLPRGSSVRPNNEVNAYGGGNMVFIPAVSLRGSDLVIAFNRASQSMSRNG